MADTDGGKIPVRDFRRVLLEIVSEYEGRSSSNLQAGSVLKEAERRVGGDSRLSHEEQEALLTAWYDLFRAGLLSWGFNLQNPNPPVAHTTEVGRRVLQQHSRDPYNPDGYLTALSPGLSNFPIAESYIEEAVSAFSAGFHRAAAVLAGAATESLVISLRDALVDRISSQGGNSGGPLQDWRVKTIRDEIDRRMTARKKDLGHALWERYSAFFVPISDQIRMVRNDAGHPSSIDPISEPVVHSSLLLFPEFVTLTVDLVDWVTKSD